jgi:hypothetical protein
MPAPRTTFPKPRWSPLTSSDVRVVRRSRWPSGSVTPQDMTPRMTSMPAFIVMVAEI